ncbi:MULTISPECIES: type II toxin-antitoxin system RelE/ParE family toxin [Proteus]|uniref:type II toxin-antitoxin system RelE/ParE family toxin n=1 Tax=Proteus TaxID=583 RepID=UPI0029E14F5F
MNYLEFIETMVFSRDRKKLMDDDEFRSLQTYMLENYENGDTIAHTGGCKKIRWYRAGSGKSGGVRIIYYTRTITGRLYLLLIYPKNSKDDLSAQEKNILKSLSDKLK